MTIKKYKKVIYAFIDIFIFLGIVIYFSNLDLKSDFKPEAKGFQWEVTKNNKSMYLIGTMHPINKEYNYFNKNVKDIIRKTDVLAVEINPSKEEIDNINAKNVYINGHSIEDELNKNQIKNLKSICNEIGIDYKDIKNLKPHIIMNKLESVLYYKANLVMETFDDMLKDTIVSKGKRVVQLENMEFQMDLLSKINGLESLKLNLNNYKKGKFLESGEETIKYSKELMDGYAKGNKAIMEKAIELQKKNPLSYRIMITNRNKVMTKKIDELFLDNETYTVAVGALHFFGDESIIKMLENKGYTVNSIE
ncbi:TraB/GumN family protein [Clostridium sp.]|uniref:TraB/GumN family protein n=1 Tax=Clostridium sp. TaxID=1506 RepID=UPI0026DD43C5|nr:TraB/GumN family protein [Clostridium sp.]MDO5038298.1 TraB/GumN family protein [Clostridium sp.]